MNKGENLEGYEVHMVKVQDLYSGENKKRRYWLQFTNADGEKSEPVSTEMIKKIDLFEMFGIPDLWLGKEEREQLCLRLQEESMYVPKEAIYGVSPGINDIKGGRAFVFGDKVISNLGDAYTFQINSKDKVRSICDDPGWLRNNIREYIHLLPLVTPLLFYCSLFSVIRPLLVSLGYRPEFIIGIIGASGTMKSSLVRKYALWLVDQFSQIANFKTAKSIKAIIQRKDQLEGQAYCIDDLHKSHAYARNQTEADWLDAITRDVSIENPKVNILFTAERMPEALFSCFDRILQIRFPNLNNRDIEKLTHSRYNVSESITLFYHLPGR